MGIIGDSLDRAAEDQFTRKPPVSTQKRAEFLLKQLGSTRAVAQATGVTQRAVERWLDGTRKNPPKDIASKIDQEVKSRWQPLVRKRAADRAASTGGITVETRAWFGYTAAPGSSDDPRLRRITEHLPPSYASRLFEARASAASEEELEEIVAEGLQEIYFKDSGRRAQGLEVEFTDIDYMELDY